VWTFLCVIDFGRGTIMICGNGLILCHWSPVMCSTDQRAAPMERMSGTREWASDELLCEGGLHGPVDCIFISA
jgi:hypothetical protein